MEVIWLESYSFFCYLESEPISRPTAPDKAPSVLGRTADFSLSRLPRIQRLSTERDIIEDEQIQLNIGSEPDMMFLPASIHSDLNL